MTGVPTVRASQYRALYRMTPVLYRLGDLRLPFAMPLDSLVLWLVYAIALWAAYRLPPLRWLPLSPLLGVPLGAWVLTWATTRLDPAGKSPPVYLLGLAAFALRPRRLCGWRPCPRLPRRHAWSVEVGGPATRASSAPGRENGPRSAAPRERAAPTPVSPPAWDLAPPSPPAAPASRRPGGGLP